MPSVAPSLASGKKMKSAFAVYSQQKTSNGLKTIQKKNKKGSMTGTIKKLLGSSNKSVSDTLLTLTNEAKANGNNKHIVPKTTPQLAKPDHKNLSVKKSAMAKATANGEIGKSAVKPASSTNDTKSSTLIPTVANSPSVAKKIGNEKISKSDSKLKINKESPKKVKGKNLLHVSSDVESSLKGKKVKKNAPECPLDATLLALQEEGVIKMVQKRKLPSSDCSMKSNSKASKGAVPVAKLLQSLNKIEDSSRRGECVLEYLLAPYTLKEFFSKYWEKNHLLIKRKDNRYFDGLFSTTVFDNILRQQHVEFTKNLDITSYSNGVRETHNPVGRVYPPVVWDYYSNGCSLRMLNPQTFHKPVWRMLASLQEYMSSFCGANMYLTPAGTQGFAPHWDDIEAFILQLEGKKRWRVYKPRFANEFLPRFSSPNLSQEEIGEPILDTILEAGDILYFPRGFIHQGEAVEETHSLHITFSTYQKNAWVDLFEKIMSSSMLGQAAATNASLRQGLPLGCFDYMGTLASSSLADKAQNGKAKKNKQQAVANKEKLRKEFKQKVVSLMVDAVLTDETVDRAVDEVARSFVRVALPPPLTADEVACTVKGDGERWGNKGVVGRVEMDPESQVRLLGARTIRLVPDTRDNKGEYLLYHNVENSREYEGREEQFVVVEEKHLPAVRHLVQAYPHYTSIEDLPLPTLEDKLTMAMALWEKHLLITQLPLETIDDDDDDDDCSCSDQECTPSGCC